MHATATLEHEGPVTDLAIGADGRTVVTCSGNTLSAWDITSRAVQWSLHSEEAIVGVALRREDVIAITGTGAALLARLGEQAPSARVVAEGEHSSFTAIAVSADGRARAAGLNDGRCQLFDATRRPGHEGRCQQPDCRHPSPGRRRPLRLGGSPDGFVRVFSFDGEQREFFVAFP